MTNGTLHINGEWRDLGADYTLGFVNSDEGPVAVLYHHGKRVTARWVLRLIVEMEADPHGGNANTAG
jgi:hypothetical protein